MNPFFTSKFPHLLFKHFFLKNIVSNPNSSLKIDVIDNKPFLIIISPSGKKQSIDISPYVWDSIENMYFALLFGEMISQGYFLCPIENGYLCINSKNQEYQISINPYHCSCGNYHWKDKGYCKHILMLKGYFKYKERISSFLLNRFN